MYTYNNIYMYVEYFLDTFSSRFYSISGFSRLNLLILLDVLIITNEDCGYLLNIDQ